LASFGTYSPFHNNIVDIVLNKIIFMGNCHFKSEPSNEIVSISRNHFQFLYPIGRGGFGKVWRVEFKKEKQQYAMKEMSKARILSKKSVNSVLNERKILAILRHKYASSADFLLICPMHFKMVTICT
jgi:serine/threonine protein kinase